MESTTSGCRSFQPAGQESGGGASRAEPSGAPASTQASMAASSAGLRDGSLANSPNRGSANHGGILRSLTASRIAFAHGRVSPYVTSDMGAISPGR